MNTNRLAAGLVRNDAIHAYSALFARYQLRLTVTQLARLHLRWQRHGPASALNLLLGQLAARDVSVDPEMRRYAEAVCDEWAGQKRQRRTA